MPTVTDPNQSYYAQIQTDLASSNPQTGIVGALGASTAPTVAQQQLGVAGIESQLGTEGPELQQQGDYAAQLAGYQLGGLGINAQQTALQQQGTEQSYALGQQGFAQQGAENALNYKNELQSMIGSSAASGALNTHGSTQQQGTLAQENTWQNATLEREEQQSAGDYARAQQNYALMAKANGLSQQEVETRLQYGLSQLGEGAASDVDQLAAQAGNALSGSVQGVGSTLSQAGLLGGMNALAGLG